MEINNVSFVCDQDLICTFVPEYYNNKTIYEVYLSSKDSNIKDFCLNTKYENGTCIATFDLQKLYSLKIGCHYQFKI